MNRFLAKYRWVVLAVVAVGLTASYAATQLGGGSGSNRVRGQLGPTPGPDASGYVEAKSTFLAEQAQATPDRLAGALVSLSALARAVDVTALAGDLQVDAVFTSFPGEDPGALAASGSVDVTVGQRAEELATAKEAEIAALEEQAAASGGEERDRRLRAAAEIRTEVSALRGQCFCVYAFVVRDATLRQLAELAERDGVRLVDVPEPVVPDLRGWELRPLLPPS